MKGRFLLTSIFWRRSGVLSTGQKGNICMCISTGCGQRYAPVPERQVLLQFLKQATVSGCGNSLLIRKILNYSKAPSRQASAQRTFCRWAMGQLGCLPCHLAHLVLVGNVRTSAAVANIKIGNTIHQLLPAVRRIDPNPTGVVKKKALIR